MPSSRPKKEFHSLHLNGAIYPEALAAVRDIAYAEDRTAANTAAILVCEAYAARQRRDQTRQQPTQE